MSDSRVHPDFLIKSQSVEHKSGQLPLFFKYHLILFHSMPFTRSKTDYQKLFKDPACLKCCCTSRPTSLSSRPFPPLRFSRDPLSGWDTSSCAPIGQDATCFFELIGRNGKTHLWPRQKHAPGPNLLNSTTILSDVIFQQKKLNCRLQKRPKTKHEIGCFNRDPLT